MTLVAALLVWPLVAAAQRPIPAPDSAAGVGSIRGEVFDSLVGAHLEGAHVRVQGTSLFASTDERGRFRLDSVPAGTRVLVLDHPALDSAGLSDLPRGVEVVAGRTTEVRLAIPSLRTIAATTCAGSPPPAVGDSGLVFGSVRDAESGFRIAGATVDVSWVAVEHVGGQPAVVPRSQQARTDSIGNYYVCGVAPSVGLNVTARTGFFSSGELQFEIGERRLLRYDLSVSVEEPEDVGDTLPDTRRGLAVVLGNVRIEGAGPLAGARASVPGVAGEAVTDSAGRFMLAALPAGSQMLFVRRVGYRFAAQPVELRSRDTTRVTLELSAVTLLDTIRVTAAPWVRAELDELEQRLRSASVSRVLTSEALRSFGSVGAALQNFPALWVQRRPGGVSIYMTRGTRPCRPAVWIDGWQSDLRVLEALRPEELIALEVYPRFEVPLRYQGFSECGVVLAWTRSPR